MFNPQSSALNPGAVTRMKNAEVAAKQDTMPLNHAAQLSLKQQVKGNGPKGPSLRQNSNELPPLVGPQVHQPVQMPTGGPAMPPEAAQGFDPEVFKEDTVNELLGTIRTNKFINSPQVKDAASSVRFRNFMNNGNSTTAPDPRNFLQQVLDRMKM